MHDTGNTTNQGVAFIETTPVLEFEKKNNTTIDITISKPKEDPFIPHRYASFSLGGKKLLASVNKSITSEEEKKKNLLSISHCRDEKGNLFWLIHRSDRVMVSPASPVDIDALNNELDHLLID